MTTPDEIISYIQESIQLKKKMLTDHAMIVGIASMKDHIIKTYTNGDKILIAGNGGSAADAEHFAAELEGRYRLERKALPAMALTTNTSTLTAIANDYGYDKVFSRQLEAYARKGDIFIGISTSGNSENIIEAMKYSKDNGIKTIGLLGRDGGKLRDLCDISIVVPSDNTPRIQESHIFIIHTVCELVENELYKR
jgi:D-sedoheptulose 7-phosphate isomerase